MTTRVAVTDLPGFDTVVKFIVSDDEIQDSTIASCRLSHLDKTPFICLVDVQPKLRRQGFGTMLIMAIVKYTETMFGNLPPVTLDVYIHNEAAISLYKKCGFVITGQFKYAGRYDAFHMQYRRRGCQT